MAAIFGMRSVDCLLGQNRHAIRLIAITTEQGKTREQEAGHCQC